MKRQRKKYERPLKPWDRQRIGTEKVLLKTYGLRRKKEIWKAEAILRNFRRQARELAAERDKEREKILLGKLNELGLIDETSTLDDVLGLNVENILDRRLQTLVFKKGLAKTPTQARQFITHGHISLEERKLTWPSTLIKREEEKNINFYGKPLTESVKVGKEK